MRSSKVSRANGRGTSFNVEPALSERSESGAAEYTDRGLQPLRPSLTDIIPAPAMLDQA